MRCKAPWSGSNHSYNQKAVERFHRLQRRPRETQDAATAKSHMMLSRSCSLVYFITLFLCTNTFILRFYENGNACSGQVLGSWIGGEGQGCSNDFMYDDAGRLTHQEADNYSERAGHVEIQSTGPVDDDRLIRFYSSGDCMAGTEIAEGSVGCTGIDGQAVGPYRSFQIVTPKTARPWRSPTSSTRAARTRYPISSFFGYHSTEPLDCTWTTQCLRRHQVPLAADTFTGMDWHPS